MKQKIVVKLDLHCHKCRTKALKVAATSYGVTSVALVGEDKDKVEVIGEGVDAVALANCFRKKFKYASLESVEELKADENSPASESPPAEGEGTNYPAPYWGGDQSCRFHQLVVWDPSPPHNTCTFL